MTPPLSHVRYLADDALGGREVGSPGASCAADYVAAQFRQAGLQPAASGSFLQTFPVRGGSQLGGDNGFEVSGTQYTLGEEWIPYGFAEPGQVTGELVYGHYGVGESEDSTPPPTENVEGRILVVEHGDPASSTGRSLHADPHFKASVAAGQGALGIVVLLGEGDELPEAASEERPSSRVPAIAVRGSAAKAIRDAARAGDVATLRVDVEARMVEAYNVAALLPGRDPNLAGELVIVGAHCDHLGYGGEGSLSPDERVVHNGADDNASGTAALLAVASELSRAKSGLARSVLFLAFTGEEKGLWGSAHYAASPLLPIDRTVAMLNMDMVGRLRENKLTVFGAGTAEEWGDIIGKVNSQQAETFQLVLLPDGYGPSDHSSFYGKGIPVLHFFTNTHEDYHRPSDDWDKIDADGLSRISGLVTDLVVELAGEAEDPDTRVATLTLVEGAGNPHAARPGVPGEAEDERPTRGYGPYLGTIPDMTPSDVGVRLTGVREGSPAQRAGLRGGDVIVGFGGQEISDLYAYTYALREHEPGDEVEIVVLRDGAKVILTAVLGSR